MYTIGGITYAEKKEVPAILGVSPRWVRALITRGMPRKKMLYKGRCCIVYPVEEIKEWYTTQATKTKRVVNKPSKQGSSKPIPVSICWDCTHAAGRDRCCWARNFEPVPGWEAIETKTLMGLVSYAVMDCPMFERDKKRK